MKRSLLSDLIAWKNSTQRKPLILQGARQTGKTWLLKEFSRTQYDSVAYISMDDNRQMQAVFAAGFDIPRILQAVQLECGIKPEPGRTLIIFDEIQEIPLALKSLKYFCENAPEYHIAAAGSLLGLACHQGVSFPVGKVDFLNLYPLSFCEFLEAVDSGKGTALADVLRRNDTVLMSAYNTEYTDLLKKYLYIGGMPEAVRAFAANTDFAGVRKIHESILRAYDFDFSKHAGMDMGERIRQVWKSLPAQLGRENRKFLYGLVKAGARAREYETALQWLSDAGLVYRVHNVTKPALPLISYEDAGAFKFYALDTGLLATMSGLEAKTILEGSTIFTEYKGALTEQYVLQELLAQAGLMPSYWSQSDSKAEIDFLVQKAGQVIPVEVKSAENLQAKSLKSYCEKFVPATAVRTSLSGFRQEAAFFNVPLYDIGCWLKQLQP